MALAGGIELKENAIDGQYLLLPDPERLLVWRRENTWAVRKGS